MTEQKTYMGDILKPSCPNCGSDNVGKDAYARWDLTAHKWVLGGVYDDEHCSDCEWEGLLEWNRAILTGEEH